MKKSICFLVFGVFLVLFGLNLGSAGIIVTCDDTIYEGSTYEIPVKGEETHQGDCGALPGANCWVEDCQLWPGQEDWCTCRTYCNNYIDCVPPQWENGQAYGFGSGGWLF